MIYETVSDILSFWLAKLYLYFFVFLKMYPHAVTVLLLMRAELATATAPTQPAKSSAQAVRTAIAKSPSTINESTQTDLTWPLTASYQVAIPTATTHSSTNTTESLTTVELFVTKQGVFVMYGDKTRAISFTR